MGFLDSLRSWFRTEAAEAREVLDHTQSRMATDLDRREAALEAGPSERLEMLQEEISANDDGFEALRDRIEGRSAKADAVEEIAEQARDTAEAARDTGETAIDEAEVVDEGPADGTP